MKVTENFYLQEFFKKDFCSMPLCSGINCYPDPNCTGQDVVRNIRDLCLNILQPLRDMINLPIIINSGYRCPIVNEKVKGKTNSQHLKGQAADICIEIKDTDFGSIYKLRDLIKDKNLLELTMGYNPHDDTCINMILWILIRENFEFDQVILEPRKSKKRSWVHVSYNKNNNRKMVLS